MTKNNTTISASLKSVRISPRKLNLVAQLIRKMPVHNAIVQLQFSKRRIAKEVLKCLRSAVANAENNHGLDIDKLYIERATVGKALVMKRVMPKAKGRGDRIDKFFSSIYLTISEGGN